MAKGPKKTHVIRTPDQLKALRTPIRKQIIGFMSYLKSCSVNELAPYVGLAPESIYYHVNNLVQAGLVKERHKRLSGKRMESVYELVAPQILVDKNNCSEDFLEALKNVYSAALRSVERGLNRALDYEKTLKGSQRKTTELRHLIVRLNPKSKAQVRRMLKDLDGFLLENNDPDAKNAYSITTIFNLMAPPSDKQ